eukprot:SAG31_NODE_2062_length_6536_cov_8.777691_3_plen_352_part_00
MCYCLASLVLSACRQNMAGFTTLRVTGPKGTVVTLQHSELLGSNGLPHNIYYPGDGASMTKSNDGSGRDPSGAKVRTTCGMTDSRSGGGKNSGWYERGWFECANQTDSYTLKGGGAEEVYTPSFTYHGFRFVAIRGLPAGYKVTDETLTAHFVHSDLPKTGYLQLPEVAGADQGTEDILNGIYHSTLCAQMSQLWSIPTDCPQREKRGWMGDAHMSSSGLMYSMDAQSFHTNFLQNINDDQVKGCAGNPDDPFIRPCTGTNVARSAGAVPDVSPFQTSPCEHCFGHVLLIGSNLTDSLLFRRWIESWKCGVAVCVSSDCPQSVATLWGQSGPQNALEIAERLHGLHRTDVN